VSLASLRRVPTRIGAALFYIWCDSRRVRPEVLSYTTPSWVTVKVITPDERYSAGYATKAKPPVFLAPET
jgi:hypothetical protein